MEHVSLRQLNEYIGETLKKGLETSYWIIAEIGEMRVTQKGHCYLEMVEKEGDQIQAKMRATIWSFTYRNLSVWFRRFTGKELQPGIKILFNATVQFHEIYGISLNIKDIDAQFTLGERAKKRKETVAQLVEDGVYDMNKELPLPTAPQHIAIISSSTAAGFGDFINQLTHNNHNYKFDIRLFEALMQGEQAEASLINAMHRVFEQIDDFDLLVIIRGGGASLDLDCFDSYELSSHIAQFPIPVITGIGHERDETIADEVAHTKMKTPTAVAEFLISGLRQFEDKLDYQFERMSQYTTAFMQDASYTLERLGHELNRNTDNLLHNNDKTLVQLKHTVYFAANNFLEKEKNWLEQTKEHITTQPAKILLKEAERLTQLEHNIKILDPNNVLQRGYTITTSEGTLIKNLHDLKDGAELITSDLEKTIVSQVKSIKLKKHD